MRSDLKAMNNRRGDGRPLPRINGKTIVACGLVVTLVFMWVKIFVGGPKEGQGAIVEDISIKAVKAESKVSSFKHRPLEYLPGRHDKLTNDMFAPRGLEIEKDDSQASKDGNERVKKMRSQKDVAGKLAGMLKLDAIMLGNNAVSRRAFINGKFQQAGDEINVKLNGDVYKVNIMEIYHNKVVLKWNDFTISVRMAKLD